MIDRIKFIMKYYELNPAQFADKIGIQRSALSHVLSGRNRPSLDFILKLKAEFPSINLDWITLGNGEMLSSNIETDSKVHREKSDESQPEFTGDLFTETYVQKEKHDSRELKTGGESQLKEIVLFYSDGTYKRFIPGK
ncbi:MAG: helix-turn-helix transcriptional regulator [Bacteroidales bacterium]|nr:helix-turn-helix transcriptional regulator [Bacteroidales bacterium]